MNTKTPNKIHEDEEASTFQERVLTLLCDLQHQALAIKDNAEQAERSIRKFRISIHGEDIDDYE